MPTVKKFKTAEEKEEERSRLQVAQIKEFVDQVRLVLPNSLILIHPDPEEWEFSVSDREGNSVADFRLLAHEITYTGPDLPKWLETAARNLEELSRKKFSKDYHFNLTILLNYH